MNKIINFRNAFFLAAFGFLCLLISIVQAPSQVVPSSPLSMLSLASYLNTALQSAAGGSAGVNAPTAGPGSAGLYNGLLWWNSGQLPKQLQQYESTQSTFVPAARAILNSGTVNFYVRGADGNDGCNGLSDAAGSSGNCSWKTWQHANNFLSVTDGNNLNVVVQEGSDQPVTQTDVLSCTAPYVGYASVTYQGNPATPDNVFINAPGVAFNAQYGCQFKLAGFKFICGTYCATAQDGGQIILLTSIASAGANFDFGTAIYQILAVRGAKISQLGTGNYTISGSATSHIRLQQNSAGVFNNPNIVLSGTPAFSSAATFGFISLVWSSTANFGFPNYVSGSASGNGCGITTNSTGFSLSGKFPPGTNACVPDSSTYGVLQ